MKKILFAVLFFNMINIYAQDKIELFPSDLNIQPFSANILEPRLGFIFQTGGNELRLDIGGSADIIKFNKYENVTWSFGADLFTYTLLRGEKDFHFPVDAVDYLFGVNFGYKNKIDEEKEIGARLRISHISAHFVDGHYDGTNNKWRNDQRPRVYSREFMEFIPYYKINDLRIYAGFTYLYHVDPSSIKKDNYQFGAEYFFDNLLSENLTPYLAYDFKLIHLDKYTGNNSINAGIKFGKKEGRGLSFYFTHYSGKSFHGEYFDFNEEYTAFGINLDL
ncbi:MAG: hypothetical protein A2068_00125 [Ignavibacteria bacterium GWB2_35_6b]|nr:MAG: hypothetical protein A2068_00125 [Ignavibacteria bacterium GWB2_35_6b]